MKRKNLFCGLLAAVTLSCGLLLGGCGETKPEVSIALDGKTITMEDTVQSCLDNGLITTDAQGNPETFDAAVFEAKTASFETLHMGTSSEPHSSIVGLMLYNPESTAKSVNNCKIMKVFYYAEKDNSGNAPFTLNGIDFWGMTEQEAAAALEEQGFAVSLDEEYHYIVTSGSGNTTISIDFETGDCFENASTGTPQKKEVSFDASTYYVSEVKVDISGKLNIDMSN